MIVYGISMQDKPHQVPEEVAVWLLERNARYPLIDFQIDYCYWDKSELEDETIRQRYSRIYHCRSASIRHGISTVGFLYLKEGWLVRIVGGRDAEGNIADMSIPHQSLNALSAEQRAEIADMPPLESLELIREGAYGLPRAPGESAQERGVLANLPADMFWGSDFAISGAKFADLFQGQPTERKTEIIEVLSRKDYGTAKKLLEQRN